jgi:hypothetical protein
MEVYPKSSSQQIGVRPEAQKVMSHSFPGRQLNTTAINTIKILTSYCAVEEKTNFYVINENQTHAKARFMNTVINTGNNLLILHIILAHPTNNT